MRRQLSMRRLLVVTLLAVIGAGSAITAALSYRDSLIETDELFDAKLAHSARVLKALSDRELREQAAQSAAPKVVAVWSGQGEGGEEGEALATEAGHAYETKLAFQVWSGEGRLLLRSDNAPERPLAPLADGFARASVGESTWRTFTLRSRGGLWYQAGERDDIRAELARDIAFGALLPLLVELPLLAALVWLIVDRGLRPLARVADEVELRAADRLGPLDASRAPREVSRLIAAINRLFARLGEAIARERHFAADAAHELRTPISALKVHLDNLRGSADAAGREAGLQSARNGVARLERTVEQLLLMSRLEPGAALPLNARLDLRACVAGELAELAPRAAARNIELALDCGTPAPSLQGDEVAIGAMTRNLVDNAIRYTPPGGRVRVRLSAGDGRVRMEVEDSGPGLDDAARERAFDRFYRGLGTGVEGSGLGLSIVRRVAELHRGEVGLARSRALGGLMVSVDLPAG